MLILFRTEIQRISGCGSDFLNHSVALYFTHNFNVMGCSGSKELGQPESGLQESAEVHTGYLWQN